jgi:hypothetical protein
LWLGKIVVGTGFCASAAVLGFQYNSKLIKRTNLKSKLYSFYINNYNNKFSLLIIMNCGYKFRLTIAIMKSTADILPVPNATNTKQSN